MKMFFLLIKEAGYDRRNLFTKQYKNRICKSRGKTKSKTVYQHPQYKEISKHANQAFIAYAYPIINKSEVPQTSMDSLIKKLKAQGKKEGKDFIIENYGKNINLTINNEYNKPAYVLHYDNGNLSYWNEIEINKYHKGKLSRQIAKHSDNSTFLYTDYYDCKEIPQNSFTKEGLTYNTTPEGYIEYLKQNKIDYKISPDKKNSSVMIYEFNKDNKKTQTTHFCKHGVSRTELNSNEEEVKHIDLRKEKTEVTNYLDTSEIKSPLR